MDGQDELSDKTVFSGLVSQHNLNYDIRIRNNNGLDEELTQLPPGSVGRVTDIFLDGKGEPSLKADYDNGVTQIYVGWDDLEGLTLVTSQHPRKAHPELEFPHDQF